MNAHELCELLELELPGAIALGARIADLETTRRLIGARLVPALNITLSSGERFSLIVDRVEPKVPR